MGFILEDSLKRNFKVRTAETRNPKPQTPHLGVHHEAGVGSQLDLLAEEGLGLWGLLLTARDEPVQPCEAREHGRELEHEDLPLEVIYEHILELGPVILINSVLALQLDEFVLAN